MIKISLNRIPIVLTAILIFGLLSYTSDAFAIAAAQRNPFRCLVEMPLDPEVLSGSGFPAGSQGTYYKRVDIPSIVSDEESFCCENGGIRFKPRGGDWQDCPY